MCETKVNTSKTISNAHTLHLPPFTISKAYSPRWLKVNFKKGELGSVSQSDLSKFCEVHLRKLFGVSLGEKRSTPKVKNEKHLSNKPSPAYSKSVARIFRSNSQAIT